jgi:peptidoglycan/xylan/chitin deacetylase (PgdA/CDA1 family)
MKRFFKFCCYVLLAGIIYAVGAYGEPYTNPIPTPAPVVTPVFIPNVDRDPDELYRAVVEYGSVAVIKHNNDPLHAFIQYPQAGNPTDAAIFDWASTLYNSIESGHTIAQLSDPNAIGEVNVHFDSYLIDNRYVGILQNGTYSYSLTALSEEVIKTFNIDLHDYSLLEAADILDLEHPENVISLFNTRTLVEHPNTDGYLYFMDESWLKHVVIGHEGIVVILPQAEFLPDSFPTLTVTLPYADLGSALLIRSELPAPPTPTLTPTPTPTPSPNPTPPDYGDDDPPPTAVPQSGTIDPSMPIIALSFDDGPGDNMNQLLDLLRQYRVRATFCVVGNIVHTQSEALARAVEIGCEVIGHSWDHKNLARLPAEDVRKQLAETSNAIEAVTGVVTPMFRPPYGAVSDTMRSVAEELGFAIVNWSVDSEDWKTLDADAVYDAVMEQVTDRAIILSHELYDSTLEAYLRLIPDLLLMGYQIVTVSELLYFSHGALTPGHVYYSG